MFIELSLGSMFSQLAVGDQGLVSWRHSGSRFNELALGSVFIEVALVSIFSKTGSLFRTGSHLVLRNHRSVFFNYYTANLSIENKSATKNGDSFPEISLF